MERVYELHKSARSHAGSASKRILAYMKSIALVKKVLQNKIFIMLQKKIEHMSSVSPHNAIWILLLLALIFFYVVFMALSYFYKRTRRVTKLLLESGLVLLCAIAVVNLVK